MHLANDYIHPAPWGGECRVRIYLPDEEQDAPGGSGPQLPQDAVDDLAVVFPLSASATILR
jgi:hypothetical protein